MVNRLIFEGPDDKHVVMNLLYNHQHEGDRLDDVFIAKAQVHTWLVWQEEPGTRMGETFRKKYLDPEHPSARALVNWIKKLLS